MRIDGYEINDGHVVAVFITDKKRNMKQHKYEPAKPHGEWIVRRNKQRAHIYSVCSKCNLPYLDTDFPNFCPNCGADMRKKVNE